MSPEAVKAAADRAEGGPQPRGPKVRPQLSSFDLLPEEADEDKLWAAAQLNERTRSQAEILFELNERLDAKGIAPLTKSAFGRTAVKLGAMSTRLNEARRIFEGVAPQFTPERVDENTVALAEFIKLIVFELTQQEGAMIGTKGAMELGKALLAVIQSQAISAARRTKLEADFKAQASKAVDAVAREKGLPDDTVRSVKAKLLGLKVPAAKGGG